MAARQKYPTAHEQLLVLAVAARRVEVPFDVFWLEAIRPGLPPVTWRTPEGKRPGGCVVWPNDTDDRALARGVFNDEEVREGWRLAYERRPPRRRDTALAILLPLLLPDDADGYESEAAVPSAA